MYFFAEWLIKNEVRGEYVLLLQVNINRMITQWMVV